MASEVPTCELNALVTCELFFSCTTRQGNLLKNRRVGAAKALNLFTLRVQIKQLILKVVKPSGY